ncbi:DDE-type integrase/transposase/recombinase [Mesorhizobium sp. AR02]|uniref:DDE-type integrase/transposase/recombinase n=1 Tax=Mesorhizobium sp. AR02 TaxID=2865837 RepID=UPI003A5BD297
MLLWPWAKFEWRAVCAERCKYGSGRRSASALLTPLHLAEQFAYLAVVLDAFSRKVIGWALELHLRASLAVDALKMAISARVPVPGSLIHHSDRGVQRLHQLF